MTSAKHGLAPRVEDATLGYRRRASLLGVCVGFLKGEIRV